MSSLAEFQRRAPMRLRRFRGAPTEQASTSCGQVYFAGEAINAASFAFTQSRTFLTITLAQSS